MKSFFLTILLFSSLTQAQDLCPYSSEDLKNFLDTKKAVYENDFSRIRIETSIEDSEIIKLCPAGENLKSLYLNNHDNKVSIVGPGLAHLNFFKNLDVLDLNLNKLSWDGLTHLPNLPHLTHIDLSSNPIWNTQKPSPGIKVLASQPSLKSINLAGTETADENLYYIAILKDSSSLNILNLSYNQIDGVQGSLKHLGQLNIKSLQIAKNPLTSADLADLSGARSLRTLDLSHNNLSTEQAMQIFSLQQIENIYLARPSTDHIPQFKEIISKATHLKTLIIPDFFNNIQELITVATSLPNLQCIGGLTSLASMTEDDNKEAISFFNSRNLKYFFYTGCRPAERIFIKVP